MLSSFSEIPSLDVLDVILFGEPLPKEKTRHGNDIVILHVHQQATEILPYYLQLKVGEVDPNFPSFILKVTIDGQKEKFTRYREVQDGLIQLDTFNEEYLGFGPISSHSAEAVASRSTDHHKFEQGQFRWTSEAAKK